MCDGAEIFMNEVDEKAVAEKAKREAVEEEFRRKEEEDQVKRMTEGKKQFL